MNIYFLDKQFSCENTILEINKVFQEINLLISELNIQIGSYEIDGVKIDEDINQYIVEHITDIQNVIINAKAIDEQLLDMIASVRTYVVRAIPEIDKLVDQFYQDVTPDTWNIFSQLLEGLQYIINCLEVINQHTEIYKEPKLFIQAKDYLTSRIGLLQSALESKDRVWLCDVLLYEIIPAFQVILRSIDSNTTNSNAT